MRPGVSLLLCVRYVFWCMSLGVLMTDADIVAEIAKHADERNGSRYLTCHRAHVIGEELDVSLARIGQLCEQTNVRIAACQLGCFGRKHA